MAPETVVHSSFSASGGITTGQINLPTSSPISAHQPVCPPTPYKAPLSFRNSKIIYYGPHACDNCGEMICRAGYDWGANRFNYPTGPIYPNTEWHPHICDPKDVQRFNDAKGIPRPVSR